MTGTSRELQREQTRQRIVTAAVDAFAEGGFGGTSTRDIARRAGITQGLLSYHFESKEELWRAGVDVIFAALDAEMAAAVADGAGEGTSGVELARRVLRAHVSFSTRHPELFQIMVDAGRHDDDRMRWIVDRHLRSRFDAFVQLADLDADADVAHLYYILIGASSLISAVAPECRALTGVDPLTDVSVHRHADLVADLILPPDQPPLG